MSRRCLISLLLPLTFLLAGCQSGDIIRVVPVAGGGKVNVRMSGKGPIPGHAEGYEMTQAILQPDENRPEVRYTFAIAAAKEPAIQRIQIEDISDEQPVPLLDDRQPLFNERRWEAKTELMGQGDPRLAWVLQITLSLRVYRVTLTATDGHSFSFNHVAVYPPFLKAAIRAKWGEKY